MPRLLPFDALDGPPVRARWTAILAVTLAMTASATDWTAAWDTTRGLVPTTGDRFEWTAADLETAFDAAAFPGDFEGIADPTGARTAQLRAKGMLLDLVWDPTLTVANVRVEIYDDGLGTGHRLAIAMDSTTADGIGCLNASLTVAATVSSDSTTLQVCSRADLHEPPGEPTGEWRPDHLFITQTANLDAAAFADPTLVDYYGFGLETGNSYDTGLWGPNSRSSQPQTTAECASQPSVYIGLDDLHLTDRYHDPAQHRSGPEPTHVGSPAYPLENRLVLPACTSVDDDDFDDITALEPYYDTTLVPLASWSEFNAANHAPQPLRTAVAFDVRSCDTDPGPCSSDRNDNRDGYADNEGIASEWLTELLGRLSPRAAVHQVAESAGALRPAPLPRRRAAPSGRRAAAQHREPGHRRDLARRRARRRGDPQAPHAGRRGACALGRLGRSAALELLAARVPRLHVRVRRRVRPRRRHRRPGAARGR